MIEIILQEAFIKAVDKLPSLQKRIKKITQDMIDTDCNLNGKYKDHQLKYNLAEYRELHILGDKLLIYKVSRGNNTITFEDIVTHKALKRKSSEEESFDRHLSDTDKVKHILEIERAEKGSIRKIYSDVNEFLQDLRLGK